MLKLQSVSKRYLEIRAWERKEQEISTWNWKKKIHQSRRERLHVVLFSFILVILSFFGIKLLRITLLP